MLALRLHSILFWARNVKSAVQTQPQIIPPPLKKQQSKSVKEKYSNLHKSGPELQITKILIKNGPLTSREIWRSYQLLIEQKREKKYLSNLKRTLGFMRTNGKISSNGYDKRKRAFKGWKIDEKRALKFVHPDIIAQLQEFKKRKNQL